MRKLIRAKPKPEPVLAGFFDDLEDDVPDISGFFNDLCEYTVKFDFRDTDTGKKIEVTSTAASEEQLRHGIEVCMNHPAFSNIRAYCDGEPMDISKELSKHKKGNRTESGRIMRQTVQENLEVKDVRNSSIQRSVSRTLNTRAKAGPHALHKSPAKRLVKVLRPKAFTG